MDAVFFDKLCQKKCRRECPRCQTTVSFGECWDGLQDAPPVQGPKIVSVALGARDFWSAKNANFRRILTTLHCVIGLAAP